MARWPDLPFLCLDTETTGVDPLNDRIVQVAAVIVRADYTVVGPPSRYEAIVNPGRDIPAGAAEVHGISTERAKAEGVEPREALNQVAYLVHQAVISEWPVVIYNARFDWPLLLAEADRHGVDFPAAAFILDPFILDKLADKWRKGKRRLTNVAEHYGIELGDDAHDASADAIAAGRVMRAILTRHPDLAEQTPAGITLRQVHGHEADRQSFADYMRRNVDANFRSAAGWPIPVEAA